MALQAQRTIQEEVTIVNGLPRVVWGAIVAGALMVMAIELGLGLLGAGIGLSLTNTAREAHHVHALGASAVIWWFSSSLVAMYVGSWVAGHFARNHGRLHGLLMWAAKTVLMFIFLATSIGAISAGAFALINPKGTARDVKNTAQTLDYSNLSAEQKQEELANADARNTQMSPEEAQAAAEKESDKAAKMSLIAFLMLALSAGVSALGGAHGARDAVGEIVVV